MPTVVDFELYSGKPNSTGVDLKGKLFKGKLFSVMAARFECQYTEARARKGQKSKDFFRSCSRLSSAHSFAFSVSVTTAGLVTVS